MSMFSKFPIARILVPYIAGIFLGDFLHGTSWILPFILALLAIIVYLFILALGRKSPLRKLSLRPVFIFPIAALGVALGWFSIMVVTPTPYPHLEDVNASSLMVGRIESIKLKDFSMSMNVSPISFYQSPRHIEMEGNILLSTRGCNYGLRNGDVIAFKPEIDYFTNMGNPDEMDYALYLKRRGILYSEHVDIKYVYRLGHGRTLNSIMANYRHTLQQRVFSTSLSDRCQEFIVALILGDKNFIDTETREQFAQAGVAHILALSGLHVGIIAALLWWLLVPLDFIGMKKVRLVFTVILVVAYAVFTGAAPSVVRSAIMLGFVFIPMFFYRKTTTLNSLLVAALVILTYSPQSLFDAGFLLSFITTGALVVFSPYRMKPYTGNDHWNYLKTIVMTSIIAMLSTIVLSAYFFHSISLISVITNVFILPIFPLFMLAAALVAIVCVAGGEINILNSITDALSRYINQITALASNLPFSHIGNLYITAVDVILLYCILSLFVLFIIRKNAIHLKVAGIFFVIFAVTQGVSFYRQPSKGLIIFNSYNTTPILYFDHQKGFLWCPDNEEMTIQRFSRYYDGFLAYHGITNLQLVGNHDLTGKDFFIHSPYAYLAQKRLLAADKFQAKEIKAKGKIKLDYLVISKHFHGKIAHLKKLYEAKLYILSGDLYQDDRKRLIKECKDLKIKFIDLKREGAFKILL